MGKFVSLIGQKFNKLTVLSQGASCKYGARWLCACDCGGSSLVKTSALTQGLSKSCGCLQKVAAAAIGASSAHDLTGMVFGRLAVMRRKPVNANGKSAWDCVCDCGAYTTVTASNLTSGHTKSCGCYARELTANMKRTHGMSKAAIYGVWEAMHQRCNNKNDKNYHHYGGRGISICEEWKTFEGFFHEMGWPPEGMTLERIDVNAGYSKSNCIWGSRTLQALNQRTRKTNTSGHVGVYPYKDGMRWVASITVRGIRQRLGLFDRFEDAVACRRDAFKAAVQAEHGTNIAGGLGRAKTV